MKAIVPIKLDDAKAEQVNQNHAQAIAELQKQPAIGLVVVASQTLPNATPALIPHPLGRAPTFVQTSIIRVASATAGLITELRDGSFDRTKYIKLLAGGYGGPIIVDVLVM